MGRPRKSSAELDRQGAFDKDPARARARAEEPVIAAPIGAPPADFCNSKSMQSLALLAIWNEELAKAEGIVYTSADNTYFASYCRLVYQSRKDGAPVNVFGMLNTYSTKLGLNPADRSRVKGVGRKSSEEEAEEWGEFAAASSADVRLQ